MSNILKDDPNKALISMSLPISIGMLSTFLFQVIDTYFVGQLGPESLAALSFSSTVYFMMVGLFIGLSVGVSVIIGQATGASDIKKVRHTTWIAALLCLVLTSLLSFLGIFFIDPIFDLMGADAAVIPLIREYMIPLLSGIPLLTTGILIGGVLRATGNITKPEVLMAIAGVINLFFDYVLIFGKWGFPELGIQGAAYATVLSWVFVILGMVILLIRDQLLRPFSRSDRSNQQIIQEIFQLGGPSILTQIIGPFTLMYLTFLLARESSLAVAAFGVAGRIETLLMIGILGISTAITPFIAQNSGAKQTDRIDQAIAFGGKASTYLGLLVAALMFLLIKPIAALFSDHPEVIQHTANYFYIVSLSYVSYGLYLITTSILNGLQLPVNSMKISLVKSLAFTLPLTLIGAYWGVTGIFIGLSLSNVLAGIYAGWEMRKEFVRSDSSLKNVSVWKEYQQDIYRVFGKKRSS
ncbi:MAG: MATE family efflux transporter [Bacteroidota bacterium]